MDTQNITLPLPKSILIKVKSLAVKRQISVSGLLTKKLKKPVHQEDAYVHAQRRFVQRLEQITDLGTNGRLATSQDDLHER